MSEVDVVVVGAGAAGLAAGRMLERAGVSFRVLEAKNRIGGRAFTDTVTFDGLPFDHGCHWLHSASLNPLREAADRLGFRYRRQQHWGPRRLFVDGAPADDAAAFSLAEAFERVDANIATIAAERRDVALSAALAADDPWRPVIAHGLSLASSTDVEETSLLDTAFYRNTDEDFPVEQGLGTLVATIAAGLPVTLSTPVSAIDWSGRRALVRTAAGELSARVVILTVSTNVIAEGAIRLTPELPVAIGEALGYCRLGHAEKVGFLLTEPMPELETQSFLTCWQRSGPNQMPGSFYCNQFGQPIISLYLGGSCCRDLELAGSAAMIDFALFHLCDVFGADFRRRIRKSLTTHWASDADVRGAYSVVRPGHAAARLALQTMFSDRLILAGEATAGEFYSTAHGAHLSGERAARLAVDAVASSSVA